MVILSKSDGEKMCDSCIRKTADVEIKLGKESHTTGVRILHALSISLCEQCADELCRLLCDNKDALEECGHEC